MDYCSIAQDEHNEKCEKICQKKTKNHRKMLQNMEKLAIFI